MNNKSDKKHKRKQKQNQPKNKKKTTSHQSKKKKEIKGGTWGESDNSKQLTEPLLPKSNPQLSISSQHPQPNSNQASSFGSYNPITKTPSNKNKWNNPEQLLNLQAPLLSVSNSLNNPKNQASRVSEIQPPPPPNAQPQGFNTLKAQSRCSIM